MILSIEQLNEVANRNSLNFDTDRTERDNMFFYGLDLKHDRLFHVSSAVKSILGYTPHEIMARGLAWFVQQICPEDLKSLNHISDKHPSSDIMPQIHYRFKTKQGASCELFEHRCLLHDSNGAPSFIIGRVERSRYSQS